MASWRRSSGTLVRLLAPLPAGPELDALRRAAEPAEADVVPLAADGSDVASLAQASRRATAGAGDPSDRWQEAGYWLSPAVALALLPFFRRGWMVPTAAAG